MGLYYSSNKGYRLLNINERLNKGEVLNKSSLAIEYRVTEKTIQRDIDELRAYLAESNSSGNSNLIKYDKSKKGYFLETNERVWLTNEEVLALSKILLESRALCKEELNAILPKLIGQVSPNDRRLVEDTLKSERYYYVPLKHGKKLLSLIWLISQYTVNHEIIEISYIRKDGTSKKHEIKPVGIMFSEYYFYIIAFMADDSKDFPTIFRVDRIEEHKCLHKKFQVPYKDRFNEGEFRKRVQFMYTGPLKKIKFEYKGESVESVLDRIPTAEIIQKNDDKYIFYAEVYGDGIDMWLRSQGDLVKVI